MLLPDMQGGLPQENHEINVTPFIDVVLVLLIIFMVAAPLSTVSNDIELPASGADVQTPNDDQIILTLNLKLEILLNDNKTVVSRDELKTQLDQLSDGDNSRIIYLQADKEVDYGDLMQLFDVLRQAGYLSVSLVGKEQTAD